MADRFQFGGPPPPEVADYLAQKALRPSFDWRDVWGAEHAHAFTVAKTTGCNVLGDIKEALDQALVQGLPFETFKQQLEPTLRGKGWWGRRRAVDPADGVERLVQLGSPRRLRIIYEANTRTAYAAGQWQRAQRTKALLPFIRYGLGPSERHRPDHQSKAGLILPVDDPFWATWWPPNGWGCKCTVRQISGVEARRLGGPSTRPEVPTRPYVNRRTGVVTEVPEGIDPGWQTNPGLERYGVAEDRLAAARQRTRDAQKAAAEAAEAAEAASRSAVAGTPVQRARPTPAPVVQPSPLPVRPPEGLNDAPLRAMRAALDQDPTLKGWFDDSLAAAARLLPASPYAGVLSLEEAALVTMWTGPAFRPINAAARGGGSAEALAVAEALDHVLRELPPTPGSYYRRVNMNVELEPLLQVGKTWTDPAFIAASRSKKIARGRDTLLVLVETSTGVDIGSLSLMKRQREILFGRFTKLLVQSVVEGANGWELVLRQTDTNPSS